MPNNTLLVERERFILVQHVQQQLRKKIFGLVKASPKKDDVNYVVNELKTTLQSMVDSHVINNYKVGDVKVENSGGLIEVSLDDNVRPGDQLDEGLIISVDPETQRGYVLRMPRDAEQGSLMVTCRIQPNFSLEYIMLDLKLDR